MASTTNAASAARRSTVQAPYARTAARREQDKQLENEYMQTLAKALGEAFHDSHTALSVEEYGETLEKGVLRPYGLRVVCFVPPDSHIVSIYILPWLRGIAIFAADNRLSQPVGVYDWRSIPKEFAGTNMPVYSPRNAVGCWHTPISEVVQRVQAIVFLLERWGVARTAATNRAALKAAARDWPKHAIDAMRRAYLRDLRPSRAAGAFID